MNHLFRDLIHEKTYIYFQIFFFFFGNVLITKKDYRKIFSKFLNSQDQFDCHVLKSLTLTVCVSSLWSESVKVFHEEKSLKGRYIRVLIEKAHDEKNR